MPIWTTLRKSPSPLPLPQQTQNPLTNNSKGSAHAADPMNKISKIGVWDLCLSRINLKLKYGVPEVQEASKNLPGARGFVFPKYQPMAIHGDSIHPPKSPNPGSSPACSLPHHQHALSLITSMLSLPITSMLSLPITSMLSLPITSMLSWIIFKSQV